MSSDNDVDVCLFPSHFGLDLAVVLTIPVVLPENPVRKGSYGGFFIEKGILF